jgi:GMP reductase
MEMKNNIPLGVGYEKFFLIPQKCIVDSRSQCDTSVEFGGRVFDMPIYPANMKSVVDVGTCKYMAQNRWFYTMHRFGVNSLEFAREMIENGYFVSISTGVNQDSYEDLQNLVNNKIKVDYVTIDIANAWSEKTRLMIKWIKDNMDTFLIVGNMATREAAQEITTWGANALKVGIGGGNVCLTRNKTGFHRAMVTSIMDCFEGTYLPIIADGGIVEHGDVAKSIRCGATMVMAGFLMAAFDQSAGDILEINDVMYKEYYGSASQYNKSEYKNVEGKKILIRYKGSMDKLLKELKDDLCSAISYSGGTKLKDLRKVPWEIRL